MRHIKSGRRFGRTTSHRTAMFRNMVTSFLEHEKITTTDAKAKELRSIAEKMVTLGKKGDLHALRQAASYIRDKKVVTKLFTTIAPRYKERPGGYTRIIKLGIRPGDNASLSIIELVEEQFEKKTPKASVKKSEPAVAIVKAQKTPVSKESSADANSPADLVGVPLSAVKDVAEDCEAKSD
jgi:large subunit ribosomal protein L17